MAKLGTDGEDVNAQATGSAKAPLAFAPRGSIEERYRPARRGGGAGAGGGASQKFPQPGFQDGSGERPADVEITGAVRIVVGETHRGKKICSDVPLLSIG